MGSISPLITHMVIYKIINTINNKIYIGQTINNLKVRMHQHKYGKCLKLKAAFQKYGYENFIIKPIVRCSSIEEMNHREQLCIKLYKSQINGYNLTSGGENGKKHSTETLEKIKKALTGKPSPKKGLPGRKWDEYQKIKYSKTMKGRPNLKNRGKVRSLEFKLKCKERVTLRNYKKVINTETNQILNSVKELQHILNKPYSTIVNWLNGTNKNKTTWKYLD